MTLLNAFPCVGACGSSVRRLRRKHGHILCRGIPAALLLGVVGCAVDVCAYALLLPHQYVAVRMLPAPCHKLHAVLGPGQFFKSVERIPYLLKDHLMWSLKRFFWPPTERRPQESSLWSRRRGSLFPGIRITWPSHLNCRLRSIVSRDAVPALRQHSTWGILCHQCSCSTVWRHRMWKVWGLSCDDGAVSIPHMHRAVSRHRQRYERPSLCVWKGHGS